MTVITTLVSIIVSIAVSIILENNEVYYLALGGASVLILELSTIIFYVNKVENSNIQKILKGESL